MAAKGRIGRGRLCLIGGERTTSVRPAYASSKRKAAGGNVDRTKLGEKQNYSENSRGRRGALRFAEEDAEAAEAKWGWSNGATNKERARGLDEERRCMWGCKRFSSPICAKSELAAERKGNGKAKWQSEMAKRNGRRMAKRNGKSENSKAKCGAKRTSRFRTAPAVSGKVYENYENSDVGFAKGSGLINR